LSQNDRSATNVIISPPMASEKPITFSQKDHPRALKNRSISRKKIIPPAT
jgi:hypothetical protein